MGNQIPTHVKQTWWRIEELSTGDTHVVLLCVVLSQRVGWFELDVARDAVVVFSSKVLIKLNHFREILWWETNVADIMIRKFVNMMQPGEESAKADCEARAVDLFQKHDPWFVPPPSLLSVGSNRDQRVVYWVRVEKGVGRRLTVTEPCDSKTSHLNQATCITW